MTPCLPMEFMSWITINQFFFILILRSWSSRNKFNMIISNTPSLRLLVTIVQDMWHSMIFSHHILLVVSRLNILDKHCGTDYKAKQAEDNAASAYRANTMTICCNRQTDPWMMQSIRMGYNCRSRTLSDDLFYKLLYISKNCSVAVARTRSIKMKFTQSVSIKHLTLTGYVCRVHA